LDVHLLDIYGFGTIWLIHSGGAFLRFLTKWHTIVYFNIEFRFSLFPTLFFAGFSVNVILVELAVDFFAGETLLLSQGRELVLRQFVLTELLGSLDEIALVGQGFESQGIGSCTADRAVLWFLEGRKCSTTAVSAKNVSVWGWTPVFSGIIVVNLVVS
jgi:hypothetical protein